MIQDCVPCPVADRYAWEIIGLKEHGIWLDAVYFSSILRILCLAQWMNENDIPVGVGEKVQELGVRIYSPTDPISCDFPGTDVVFRLPGLTEDLDHSSCCLRCLESTITMGPVARSQRSIFDMHLRIRSLGVLGSSSLYEVDSRSRLSDIDKFNGRNDIFPNRKV